MLINRLCTLCGEDFTYKQRPGRPPAFCSNECRKQSTKTRLRNCIVCSKQFVLENNPFYCSEACQVATACAVCKSPSSRRYCSHECVQRDYPPPYECSVCHQRFNPSLRWLAKPKSLDGPPTYCGSACYSARHNKPQSRVVFETSQIEGAYTRWEFIGGPLPVRLGGLPYVHYHETMDRIILPEREQHCVNFWRWALPRAESPFMPEYIAFGAFLRGVLGRDTPTGIMQAWTVWPWIIKDMPEYNPPALMTYLSQLNQVIRNNRRRFRAKNRSELIELLGRAEAIHRSWSGLSDALLTPSDKIFVRNWMTPKREYEDKTRLMLECNAFLKANTDPDMQWWLPHMTPSQLRGLADLHDELNDIALAAQLSKARKLPWGPRPDPNKIIHDRFQEVMSMALTGQLSIK